LKISKINIAFFPSLSILFVVCVLAIGANVSQYQRKIDNEAKSLTVLSEIRNNLANYLENPRHIDEIDKEAWFLKLHQEKIKKCISEGDWLQLSKFLTEFDFKTSKRRVLSEVNHINKIIVGIRISILGHKDNLYFRWAWIIVLLVLACLFAVLSSFLVFINRKQDKNLQLKNRELKKAIEDAESANLAKTEFLNVMSHEIRTPLNGVIGLTHVLAQSNPTSEQKKNIELLQFSSENLLSLVNDILDFGKIESGNVALEVQSFNLGKHLRKIIYTLDPYARSKNLTLLLEVYDEFKNNVLGDSTRIGQVIFNLVNNAIKFTQKGSVKVTLQVLQESEIDVTVKIAIKDTGIGISAEAREQVFDKFSQANSNTTRKYGGTGLGLTISQKLLEIMGSGLFLESDLDQGSEFWFQLTLPKSIIIKEEGFSDRGKLDFNHAKRALIVEDNKINLLILERYLAEFNLQYDTAANGEEAIECVKQTRYDIILMDLQMPLMDGYTASKVITKMMGDKKPVILAISATDSTKSKEELAQYGIDGFITKPIDIENLKRKLMHYLHD